MEVHCSSLGATGRMAINHPSDDDIQEGDA
jgi:hypothetical protein